MKMEAQFQRFPSVPLADLDLLLCDGLGEQNGPAGAQMQVRAYQAMCDTHILGICCNQCISSGLR